MHKSSYLSQKPTNIIQLSQTPKEEFFTLKKNNKRMKTSACFSEPAHPQTPHHQPHMDLSLNFLQSSSPQKKKRKDLESTFGEEGVLMFKHKQPKRKRNPIKKISNLHGQGESEQQQWDSCATPLLRSGVKNRIQTFGNSPIFYSINNTAAEPLSLDSFLILNKLGEGTYSQVYRAVHRHTGFICAMKVLQKWKMVELGVVQNVIRQIKINMFLEHPNIAKLYTCFDDQHFIYLICEYATDKNLFQKMSKVKTIKFKRGIDPSEVKDILNQICGGMEYIHKNQVIHRDIKPQNILLTMGKTVKICDFGWSIYNPEKELRSTLCGTPLYLAPELISQNNYDETVDIWAIGVLTYQMLTEKNPFKISQLKDLKNIISVQVCFQGMRDNQAIDFIRIALEKDPQKRTNIRELRKHMYLRDL